MNILVFGAGVIGSLYAARLRRAGHAVVVLARGARLEELRAHGIAIENVMTGECDRQEVGTTERLALDDAYDLIVVAVRRDQLASVTPVLAANASSTILFLENNPTGLDTLHRAFGERAVLGFPGAGGAFEGGVLRYAWIAQQPTTLGAWPGTGTKRRDRIVALFHDAGIRVKPAADMDGWLKCHAFFVTAICGALFLAGSDPKRLSRETETLALMVAGIREGFGAVRALGRTVSPFSLRVLFLWLPSFVAIRYWRGFFARDLADIVMARHALSAVGEMRALADDCRAMLQQAKNASPALDALYRAIDARAGAA